MMGLLLFLPALALILWGLRLQNIYPRSDLGIGRAIIGIVILIIIPISIIYYQVETRGNYAEYKAAEATVSKYLKTVEENSGDVIMDVLTGYGKVAERVSTGNTILNLIQKANVSVESAKIYNDMFFGIFDWFIYDKLAEAPLIGR